MKKRFVTFLKIIFFIMILLIMLFVVIANYYNYRERYAREHLFDFYSPDELHHIEITHLMDELAVYGEMDEIALVNSNGERESVFEVFVPSTRVSSDCFDITWKDDGVLIHVTDTDYSIDVKYVDVNGRNSNISYIPPIVFIVTSLLIVFFVVFTGMLLFGKKHKAMFAVILIAIAIINPAINYIFKTETHRIENVYITSTNDSIDRYICMENRNYRLVSDRLDRLSIEFIPDSIENIDLYTVRMNSFFFYMNGKTDSTDFIVDYESNTVHVITVGEDSAIFDIVFSEI